MRFYVGPRYRSGFVDVTRYTTDGGGSERACRDAKGAVSYRRDTLTMSLPRSCVGDPQRLRWRAESFSTRAIGTDDERILVEDAMSGRARPQRWEPGLRRG